MLMNESNFAAAVSAGWLNLRRCAPTESLVRRRNDRPPS
jgi:hypothetical protein